MLALFPILISYLYILFPTHRCLLPQCYNFIKTQKHIKFRREQCKIRHFLYFIPFCWDEGKVGSPNLPIYKGLEYLLLISSVVKDEPIHITCGSSGYIVYIYRQKTTSTNSLYISLPYYWQIKTLLTIMLKIPSSKWSS